MNIEDKLDALKKIREVDAPAFLLTRIRQQVSDFGEAKAPLNWRWAFVITSILILVLNVAILFKTAGPAESSKDEVGIENVVRAMNLTNTNQLYHE